MKPGGLSEIELKKLRWKARVHRHCLFPDFVEPFPFRARDFHVPGVWRPVPDTNMSVRISKVGDGSYVPGYYR